MLNSCRFIVVDVGDVGRHSDGGVLSNSAFGKALECGTLSIPSPRPLTGTNKPPLPFVFVGDEGFPLKTNLLRPYPGRNLEEPLAVYNYRLSRARRIVENSFGILAARLAMSFLVTTGICYFKIVIVGGEYSEGQLLQSQKQQLFTPRQL